MNEYSAADQRFMARALELAERAQTQGEVPVGAVLVAGETVLAEAYNAPIANSDATAHAEILAIRAACRLAANYRLPKTTLYVTLEPCSMCAGAIIHARIPRVVIAAREPRAGAAGSVLNVLHNELLNHQCSVQFGLFREQSSEMLKSFFKSKR
ncbi:MAG: tRNA adenosine(34) deaminase TadA [Gammaproteobacteria bacterium]|nr:tRNA adenosine(34) deaminase TadA [Gammaproteobacteria bacterium]